MGIFDSIRARFASPQQPLPLPLAQSRDLFWSGMGNGQLTYRLRRGLPGSHKAWSEIAGDIGLNGVVAVNIDWYIRNFPQSVPKVMRKVDDHVEEIVDHPVIKLIKQPMPGVSGNLVWGWVIQDYKIFGDAFLRKIRTRSGEVVNLQWLPQNMVRPVGDGKNPLTHFTYMTDGRSFDIPVKDIIHIRYGYDPDEMRRGRSPLQAMLREIATDNTASTASYGLMTNGAMPSIVIGPDASDAAYSMSPDDAKQVKQKMQEDFTGDNAGGIVVLTAPYKLDRVSLTPAELSLDTVRRVPEERICSALGLNPMVLGLGAGLDRSTYSNYERAQQAAWEDGMIPLLHAFSEALTYQLLPDFKDLTDSDSIMFDSTHVRALADDLNAITARARDLYVSGIIDKAEAKRIAGLTAKPEDEGEMYKHPTPADVAGQSETAQTPRGEAI